MNYLNPLQKDHNGRSSLRRIPQTRLRRESLPLTFGDTDLDTLPPLSNTPNLYLCTRSIHSRQYSSEIQSILPHFQRLLREDEGHPQQQLDRTPHHTSSYDTCDFYILKAHGHQHHPFTFEFLKDSENLLLPMACMFHLLMRYGEI